MTFDIDDNIDIPVPLGYLQDNCGDWDAFCEDIDLSPYCLRWAKEREDYFPVPIWALKKHGIFC